MNIKSSGAPGSAQREAILVAATAAFLRYGFKKTSMDDVARAAGVSRQGLYLYFDTKDLLFREALQHLMSDLISAARAAAEDRNLSLRDRLLGQSEGDLMGIAAAGLTEAGVADRGEQAGVTVAELSEHLLMTAKGIKT